MDLNTPSACVFDVDNRKDFAELLRISTPMVSWARSLYVVFYDAGRKMLEARVPERKVSTSCDPRAVKLQIVKMGDAAGLIKHDHPFRLCRFELRLEVIRHQQKKIWSPYDPTQCDWAP